MRRHRSARSVFPTSAWHGILGSLVLIATISASAGSAEPRQLAPAVHSGAGPGRLPRIRRPRRPRQRLAGDGCVRHAPQDPGGRYVDRRGPPVSGRLDQAADRPCGERCGRSGGCGPARSERICPCPLREAGRRHLRSQEDRATRTPPASRSATAPGESTPWPGSSTSAGSCLASAVEPSITTATNSARRMWRCWPRSPWQATLTP